ncbi:homeobox protein hox1a [Hordeum vulgare]|nr:homeobox protein hox1a [Hordeum vulgare]
MWHLSNIDGVIQGEVNKYIVYYSQVSKHPQSRMGVATHAAVAATLYHEVKKKPFAFNHCWIIFNGKPKLTQVVVDLKAGKKRNDGSSSDQFIGLDDEDDKVVFTNGRATEAKDNQQVMGNKWEKERLQLVRDVENAKIMLADETLLNEHAKKWFAEKKKEINDHMAQEVARATAAVDHVARMHAEHTARMQAEQNKMDEQEALIAASGH